MHLSALLLVAVAFQPLHADHADASSFLKSNWNRYEENYHPNYVLDDDPKTAWVEGKEGDGVGESLTLPLSTLSSARRLKLQIRNGYQKSKKLLAANGAPRDVTVVVIDDKGREAARQKATLKAAMGNQDVVIELGGRGVSVVRLIVDSVTPGTVYKDTCVSDVAVFVDSDVPYNAKAERAKRQALLAWKKERVETARYFARLPPAYPFAATRFIDIEEGGPFIADWKGRDGKATPEIAGGVQALLAANHPGLKGLAAVEREDFATLRRFRDGERPATAVVRRAEPAGRPVPLPEDVWIADDVIPFLDRSWLVLAEPVAGGTRRTRKLTNFGGMDLGRVVVGDAVVDGPLLFVPITTVSEERSITETTVHWLFRHDDAGRLVRAVWAGIEKETTGLMIEGSTPADWVTRQIPGEVFGVLRIGRDGAGKINEVGTVSGGLRCDYIGDGFDNPVDPGDPCRFVVDVTRSVPRAD
jgi:hypothetical protein